ncbi:TPA: AAA family ATPase [Shewanella algae]|uniref:AAA family ATPase n=1 Tax=Shewanella algae TaxID=38313 RepID=UPI001C55B1C2|nr:AAA family ATPase [Shewanella algae]HDS1202460.1 AAA family ATPase [Shewanella algae]
MHNRIVFTGGPGSGKTSVIDFLQSLGYPSAPEVGRKVIKAQLAQAGRALPWDDKSAFRDAMVDEELTRYQTFSGDDGIIFFDRSMLDSYGYSLLENLTIPESLRSHCRELVYHPRVFIFPPWQAIYANDMERKQDFSVAVATYHEMQKAYEAFGYELIEVPKWSVAKRAGFILAKVSEALQTP